jgi:uncharacterized protein
MSWIQTYSGRQFFPLAPRAKDVDIVDIARSLSFLCRFNGHCREFYSVADHSVRVSHIVDEEHALWGLLHDAAEAYVSDLPRPVKRTIPEFSALEDSVLEVIMTIHSLELPMPDTVRRADDILLATEARDLMAEPPQPWGLDAAPLAETIRPRSAEEAFEAFLARYRALT